MVEIQDKSSLSRLISCSTVMTEKTLSTTRSQESSKKMLVVFVMGNRHSKLTSEYLIELDFLKWMASSKGWFLPIRVGSCELQLLNFRIY